MGALAILIIPRAFAEGPEIGETDVGASVILPVIVLHVHNRLYKLHILKRMYPIWIFVKIGEIEADLLLYAVHSILVF